MKSRCENREGLIEFDPVFGVYSLRIPWVPTPTEVMRRAAILDAIDSFEPGSVLEIGCGSGALIHDLERRGFWGKGIDSSEKALGVARILCPGRANRFTFDSAIREDDRELYDYVMAMAVLEHIEDDSGAVRKWAKRLKLGGRMVISVPAHMKLWGPNDELAGHFRRYERSELFRVVERSGLRTREIRCYGYPLINVLKRIGNVLAGLRHKQMRRANSAFKRSKATAQSGVNRLIWSRLFRLYSSKVSKTVWKVLFALQRKSYSTTRGTGYILVAEKCVNSAENEGA